MFGGVAFGCRENMKFTKKGGDDRREFLTRRESGGRMEAPPSSCATSFLIQKGNEMLQQTIVEKMAEVIDYLEGVMIDAGQPEAERDKYRMSQGLQRKFMTWKNLIKRACKDTKTLHNGCVNEGIS